MYILPSPNHRCKMRFLAIVTQGKHKVSRSSMAANVTVSFETRMLEFNTVIFNFVTIQQGRNETISLKRGIIIYTA